MALNIPRFIEGGQICNYHRIVELNLPDYSRGKGFGTGWVKFESWFDQLDRESGTTPRATFRIEVPMGVFLGISGENDDDQNIATVYLELENYQTPLTGATQI